jgi:5-formyltetrahydrofolate cyclo-ligase
MESSPPPPKQVLRETMLAARLRLGPDERAARSRAACDRLVALPEFRAARCVALYASIGAEVDTGPIARAGAAAGKQLAWPRLAAGSRQLEFAACAPEDLLTGPRGTREPPPAAPPVPLDALDLVVVPGVAFDELGWRLGRGGGYYDATLAALPVHVLRVALAFDLQLVPAVPGEAHDAAVHLVVTEARLVRAPRPG